MKIRKRPPLLFVKVNADDEPKFSQFWERFDPAHHYDEVTRAFVYKLWIALRNSNLSTKATW